MQYFSLSVGENLWYDDPDSIQEEIYGAYL